jgi:hypothetical protein
MTDIGALADLLRKLNPAEEEVDNETALKASLFDAKEILKFLREHAAPVPVECTCARVTASDCPMHGIPRDEAIEEVLNELLALSDAEFRKALDARGDDAVNDLREVGSYAAGGTRIGEDIYLPNGGTWRRIQ